MVKGHQTVSMAAIQRRARRLRRIEPGRYETEDGRYRVRRMDDPSGWPHVRRTDGWLVEDTETDKVDHVPTLARARERVLR